MSQTFKTIDVLRLEVEDPTPPGLVNFVKNPDGRLGTYGWVSSNVTLSRSSTILGTEPIDVLVTGPAPGGVAANVASLYLTPVTPGEWVAATYVATGTGATSGGWYRPMIGWLAADGLTPVGSIQYGPYQVASGNLPRSMPARQAPAGAVYAQFGVGMFSSSAGALPVTGQRLILRAVSVSKAPTSAELSGLGFIEPIQYRDILTGSSSVEINREDLSVGTLSAAIVDPTMDPTQDDLIRPGRLVRCLALNATSGAWDPLFLGKVRDGSVTYQPARRADQRASISFEAIDQVAEIANIKQPNGVATIDELPALFPTAETGLKWNVNGWAGTRAGVIVTNTPTATLLDQIAMARDTVLGYAWVDRTGRVQAWDRDEIDTTLAAALTPADYNADASITYSTGDCINEVTVKFRRVNLANNDTVEIVYGPYRDEDSIAAWNARSKEFTIQGAVDDPVAIAAYAQQILDANAVPRIRVNSLTLPIAAAGDISPARALIDLYDLVAITRPGETTPENSRIASIRHVITPTKWLTTLGFTATDSVAQPQQAPAAPGGTVATVNAFTSAEIQLFNTSFNVGSTTPSNVGSTITFTSSGPGDVFLASWSIVGLVQTSGMVNFTSLALDGGAWWAGDGIRTHASAAASWFTVGRTVRLTGIPAGDHTLGVRSWNNAAGNTVINGPDSLLTLVRLTA